MRKAPSLSEKTPDGSRNPTKSLLPLLIGGAKAGNKLLLSDVSFVYSAAVFGRGDKHAARRDAGKMKTAKNKNPPPKRKNPNSSKRLSFSAKTRRILIFRNSVDSLETLQV